ncbi:hypothetical protein RJZ56_005929 [Blastomyces dermatitidis]
MKSLPQSALTRTTGGYNWLHYIANPSHASSSSPSPSTTHAGPTVSNYAPTPAPQTPPSLAADDAVYAIWIGTNDLANHGFLTDMQEPNRTIADSMDFIYAGLDGVYARGALSFVLMNIPPMQLTPLSGTPERGGVGETWAWPDKLGNITRVSYRMWQQVAMVNGVLRHRTGYEVLVAGRYAGAGFALMDMTHLYNHPYEYLAALANVTGYNYHCNLDMSECQGLGNPESFMWFDYSHPSQRTEQIIGEQFLDVVSGESKWAVYFGG